MPGTQKSPSALRANLDRVIEGALSAKRIVGTVVLVSENGELVYLRAAGFADREAAIAMGEDAIFRLSSLTKPIVSAAALALVENGKLALRDNVSKWIPEFRPALADGTQLEITIAQLLTHTAGLGYGFLEAADGPYHRANVSDGLDQPGLSMKENLKRIASVPLAYAPGSAWSYSVAHDVAGEVIARACGCSLPEAVARFVTGPLGMDDTAFAVRDASRLTVAYADGSPEPLRMGAVQDVKMALGPGSVRFAPDRVFDADSFPSGGCGMVGSARDFAKFLEMLRSGGGSILKSQSVAEMTKPQTGELPYGPGTAFGYGLSVVINPASVPTPQSLGTFAWGGVYGHSWFVDPAKELMVVAMTNTALEGLSGQFPGQIRDAIYSSI